MVFSLALPDSAQADLQKMVAEGRTVSPAQLNKKYAADANDAKALTSWLKSRGFKIEEGLPRPHQRLRARYRRADREALNVNMVRVTKDGITYTAAQDAPSLPASVGRASVQSSDCSRSAARTKQFRICRPAKRRAGAGAPGEPRHRQRRSAPARKLRLCRPNRQFTTDISCRKY